MLPEDNNIQDMPIPPDIGESGDDTIENKVHVTYERVKFRGWTVSENINVDVSAGRNRINPSINFGDGLGPTTRSYQTYFYLNFPMLYLVNIIDSTNTVLTNKHRTTTTKGEMVKFFWYAAS